MTVPDKNEPDILAPQWNALNALRLCADCEDNSGVSAGADEKDLACCCCGQDYAPYIYPALSHHEGLVVERDRLREAMSLIHAEIMCGDYATALALAEMEMARV